MNNPWSDPARSGVAKEQVIKLAEHVNCFTQEKTKDIMNFISEGAETVSGYKDFESDDDAFIDERIFNSLFSSSVGCLK